jgi:hypothetical protein
MARCGGGRPTTEDGITLDIRFLTRTNLVPGQIQSGHLRWTWPNTRKPVCQIEYLVTLGENTGSLRLSSISLFDRFGRPARLEGQTIHLVTTTPPYGGRRWWFLCPSTGRRMMKLHLPYGASAFASRQAYSLGYAVQREGASARARRRARKARGRIGGSANLLERLPMKPRWMRWATYWRHVEACHKTEQDMLRFLVTDSEKVLRQRPTP